MSINVLKGIRKHGSSANTLSQQGMQIDLIVEDWVILGSGFISLSYELFNRSKGVIRHIKSFLPAFNVLILT